MDSLMVKNVSLGKIKGASPSEDKFYVAVLFDISNAKKYRKVVKALKGYCNRIQYSTFEAYLKSEQIKSLTVKLKSIMEDSQYYNANDEIRIYKIAGNCELTAFGHNTADPPGQDIFI